MPISEAEAQVMQVLWDRHPRSADEVVAALASSTDWAEPTVKTLLNRLLNKGAIEATREGRRYLYSPVLARQAWVAQQRSEEHTSELQSLMRISYAVFCLNKKKTCH